MKNKLLIIFFLFLHSTLSAHSGSIQGKVIDQKTNSPLEYVRVAIPALNLQMSTNLSGTFFIANLEAGNYTLEFYCFGHAKKTLDVVVKDHETSIMKIALETSLTQLKEVKIQTDQLANTNMISNIDIKLRPVNTAQDILRMVPGLFIAQHAGGGKAEQIFLRGFDCDHGTDINVSVDGMPVNMVSHAHGQGYADLHFLIPETVERVNVRKGSYNASIGNLATAGAVQFQTKTRLDNNIVSLEGGQFNTFRMFTMLNVLGEKARAKDQNFYIAGEYFYRCGYFDYPDNFSRSNVFAKYTGLVHKHHRVTLQLSNFDSKWNASGQIPERAVTSGLITRFGSIDPTEGGATSRLNASLKVESNLHHGHMLRQQIYFSKYDFNLFSNFTFYKNDPVNGDKIRQREQRKILGYNSAIFHSAHVGKMYFNTEAGAQIRYDHVKNNELSNVSFDNQLLKRYALGDVNELNMAVYVNETIDVSKKIRMNLGLREDYFLFDYTDKLNPMQQEAPVSKTILSPKFNLYYTLNQQAQLFFLSGKGFHSNDTRVVVTQKGHEILPPAYGAEVGGNFKPANSLLVTTSLWWLYLKQEFVYVGDEAVVEPSGKTQRVGLDLGLRYDINKYLNADADFNYSIPRAIGVASNENRIPLAPTITSIGGLSFKTNIGLSASLRYRYIADRPANELNTIVAKGYFINDAVLEYSMKKFVFGISAENIFNQTWKEAQFETESQLKGETVPVTEIHFTSGTPFFMKAKVAFRF